MSIIAKGGSMMATSGLIADAVIFTDNTYLYLAITGAIVSMFGVIHEIFGTRIESYALHEIFAEIIKGVALGLLAIPFWYLVITQGLLWHLVDIDVGNISNSLALIVSFALSWYTVPLFDWLTGFIRSEAK